MEKKPGLDRFGKVVEEDDLVRLLRIRPSILKRLAGDEHADVSSMLGQVLPVYNVFDDGLVWVSLTWKRADGATEIHSIAVDPEAIELVEKSSKPGSDE
ncbi:hypothetical protein ACO0LF_16715 [Undibacterium sp. Di27W]|uniref:hypothetical protein n=1 Tax=Undibacterium sp. Di27W TaxID=3413036 RepID=UPI003BF048D3